MKILGLLLILFFPTFSFAAEKILCKQRHGGPDVVITLSEFKKFDRTFNCISGKFVSDSSGCAPDGAFGLHAPTGGAELVEVVDRWQDYTDHLGGITSNFVTGEKIYFSGGFNSPSSGYKDAWNFTVSRLTGEAQLAESDGEKSLYSCQKIEQKF